MSISPMQIPTGLHNLVLPDHTYVPDAGGLIYPSSLADFLAAFYAGCLPVRYSVTAAPTAATGTTQATAAALPVALAETCPVTGSDGTKGVILSALEPIGKRIILANLAGAQPLIVYPPSGAAINGLAANAAFTGTSGRSVEVTQISAGVWAAIS